MTAPLLRIRSGTVIIRNCDINGGPGIAIQVPADLGHVTLTVEDNDLGADLLDSNDNIVTSTPPATPIIQISKTKQPSRGRVTAIIRRNRYSKRTDDADGYSLRYGSTCSVEHHGNVYKDAQDELIADPAAPNASYVASLPEVGGSVVSVTTAAQIRTALAGASEPKTLILESAIAGDGLGPIGVYHGHRFLARTLGLVCGVGFELGNSDGTTGPTFQGFVIRGDLADMPSSGAQIDGWGAMAAGTVIRDMEFDGQAAARHGFVLRVCDGVVCERFRSYDHTDRNFLVQPGQPVATAPIPSPLPIIRDGDCWACYRRDEGMRGAGFPERDEGPGTLENNGQIGCSAIVERLRGNDAGWTNFLVGGRFDQGHISHIKGDRPLRGDGSTGPVLYCEGFVRDITIHGVAAGWDSGVAADEKPFDCVHGEWVGPGDRINPQSPPDRTTAALHRVTIELLRGTLVSPEHPAVYLDEGSDEVTVRDVLMSRGSPLYAYLNVPSGYPRDYTAERLGGGTGGGAPRTQAFEDYPTVEGAGGIAPRLAFGRPTVHSSKTLRGAGGIAPRLAFGRPHVAFDQTVELLSVAAPLLAFGEPTVIVGPAPPVVGAGGIAPRLSFGRPTVVRGEAPTVQGAGGIAPRLAFGRPSLEPGAVTLHGVGGIAPRMAFGEPTVTAVDAPAVIGAGGIGPRLAFGEPRVLAHSPLGVTAIVRGAGGIAPRLAFGQPKVIEAIVAPSTGTSDAWGQLIDGSAIEDAAVATLRRWLQPALEEVYRQRGRYASRIPDPIVASWQRFDLADQQWPDDSLPAILVSALGEPHTTRGPLSYDATVDLEVTVVVAAGDYLTSRTLAQRYVKAIAVALDTQGLGASWDEVRYQGSDWSIYDQPGGRQVAAAVARFEVEVGDSQARYSRLDVPPLPDRPPLPDTEVEEVRINVRKEEP